MTPQETGTRNDGPSPLVGEGARRADEGSAPRSEFAEKAIQAHHTVIERRTLRLARRLRKATTPLEDRLWEDLRSRRFASFKFRRQVPIGRYVADFACFSAKLVIELDGSQHADSAHDRVRDAELRQRGFHILRFWNSDFVTNHRGVLDAIYAAVEDPTP